MNDEMLYLKATNEVEGENKDPALWAKVMTLSDGDQDKAKYQYIKLRVEQLKAQKNIPDTKKSKTKTIPAQTYAETNNVSLEHVINLIKENQLQGHAIGDTWYVKIEDIKNKHSRNIPTITEKEKLKVHKQEAYISSSNISQNLMPHIWWRSIGIIIYALATYYIFQSQSLILEEKGIKLGAIIIDSIKYIFLFGILNSIYSSIKFSTVGTLVSSKNQFIIIGFIYGLLTGIILGACYGFIKSIFPYLFSAVISIIIYYAFADPKSILVSYLKSQSNTNIS